ncbi:MAG: class IV adenylate cyclase [Bacteroidota bacterium]
MEIEVKILAVDLSALKQKLSDIGAELAFRHEFWAIFWEDPEEGIVKRGDLLRLRQEGPETRLTYKKLISSEGTKIMEELETVVEDMGAMKTILEAIGMKSYQSTRKFRTQYELPQGHIVIDEYQDYMAKIPPFVEIETDSEEKLYEIVSLLGFRPEDCKSWNTHDLMVHYGVK